MDKKVFSATLLSAVMFLTSGCVVRTYQLTRDRIDQDLTTGNRGYISGQSAPVEKERKATRDTQVIEVELGSPIKFNKKCPQPSQGATKPVDMEQAQSSAESRGYINESVPGEVASSDVAAATESYTVGKGDTLQKISKKLFGTTKKWHAIYKMNQDALKSPDSIYPGQVIRVPAQAAKENLK